MILFLASNNVFIRGAKGKFASEDMSLSVKSMASCSTALPEARFSIRGILWPVYSQNKTRFGVNGAHFQKIWDSSVVSVLFRRAHTSKIEFALFKGVKVGEGGLY